MLEVYSFVFIGHYMKGMKEQLETENKQKEVCFYTVCNSIAALLMGGSCGDHM